ncbi:MAG TPA: TldD/PmbA family protein [Bryobacteraceae bacterium]|nr:TldD/PmbA family protein [Bryobacteraceae bacterium]
MLVEAFNPARCADVFNQVANAARTHGVSEIEIILAGSNQALTRFANSAIHQNVAERTTHLSVRPMIDGRTARAGTNRLDAEAIRQVVEEAVAITRLTEADAEMLPLASAAPYDPVDRHFEGTANATPEERAQAVAEAIAAVECEHQTAAGIYSTDESVFALMNSRGISAWYAETMARFSITAMARDSSGWAKASACNHAHLNPPDLARAASRKAAGSCSPRELPPGRYTVILEPAAVLDLVGQMFGDFSATAIRDGRSFLTDRIGKKLFGENITIHDDAWHPLQAGAPFDGEGVPRTRLTLVDQGVVREIAYSRQAAHAAGAAPTGHGYPLPNEYGESPANIVIEGGSASVEEMVKSTSRGILVTRFWYIREVDPYEKMFTGMTRDGVFLVEDGRITAGLRNFRFNQSLLELLSNAEMLSAPARVSGEEAFDMVVPAMKVRDFNFTDVTRF